MNWRRLINLAGVKLFSKPELSHPGNQQSLSAYQLIESSDCRRKHENEQGTDCTYKHIKIKNRTLVCFRCTTVVYQCESEPALNKDSCQFRNYIRHSD